MASAAEEGEERGYSGLARLAVGLAALVVIVVVVPYTFFFVAFAGGGDDAISDTWVGALGGVSLLGGLVVSLVALMMAIVAKVRRDRSQLLWLPLSVFPTLLALVVLAELFVME
jgi:hypothetical protein